MESNKRYACNFPLCTHTVRNSAELEKHMVSHMNKKNLFSCPALGCKYTTPVKRGLLIHWHSHARKAASSPGTLHGGSRNATRNKTTGTVRRKRANKPSNDASDDITPDDDSDSSSSMSHGIPWQGRTWPHDFLQIMEDSAALNNATGGCHYLDTPDGRKKVPAHLLLYELYEKHVVRDKKWLMKPEEEVEWSLQSETLRWEKSFPVTEFATPAQITGREGCLCGEWMVESGYWNKEDYSPPAAFTNGQY